MITSEVVEDRHGGKWRRAADGWCCLAPCRWHGNVPHADCADHDHLTTEVLEKAFGPTSRAAVEE